jgi:flagellar biogenesis protein FliO
MSVRFQALDLALALLLPCYSGSQSTEAPRPALRAAQTPIGFKTEPSMTEELVRTGAVLALLAVGLVSSAYGYRHLQRQRFAGPARRLKVVETLPLAPKTRLFLVELDHHIILLGQHGATLSVLADHASLKQASDPPAASETK